MLFDPCFVFLLWKPYLICYQSIPYWRSGSTTVTNILKNHRLIQSHIQTVQSERNWSLEHAISKKLNLIYLNTFDSNHLEKLNKWTLRLMVYRKEREDLLVRRKEANCTLEGERHTLPWIGSNERKEINKLTHRDTHKKYHHVIYYVIQVLLMLSSIHRRRHAPIFPTNYFVAFK